MLDNSLKEQLKAIFANLESEYQFDIYASQDHESYSEMVELLEDAVASSPKFPLKINEGTYIAFNLLKNEEQTGVVFSGIPNGHEFTSPLFAELNSDGTGN